MAEQIIVRMNNQYQTEILAQDEHGEEFQPVADVGQLTPYGMLLAGLASCTAIVMHTYAQHRPIDLQGVELRVRYDRVFREDCENCERIHEYSEQIDEEIVFLGELSPKERERLFAVSKHCPIHKMLARGVEIKSRLGEV